MSTFFSTILFVFLMTVLQNFTSKTSPEPMVSTLSRNEYKCAAIFRISMGGSGGGFYSAFVTVTKG